nr:putative serine/threonine-protein kinase iksa [Quercus suber]
MICINKKCGKHAHFLYQRTYSALTEVESQTLHGLDATSSSALASCACRAFTGVVSDTSVILHTIGWICVSQQIAEADLQSLSHTESTVDLTQLAHGRGHAHQLSADMAEDTPPRQMSLIPYTNESREIVLRRGNAVVTRDPSSQQLSVTHESDGPLELTECPYCHRPWQTDDASPREEERGRAGRHTNHAFRDPNYFRMLATSQRATPAGSGPGTPTSRLFQPALRSGRSRDVSGATGPPTGAEFVASEPADPNPREGISSSAFSPGFFKQFFVEKGELGRGGNGVVLLIEHVMDRVSLGEFACKRIPVGNDHAWLEKVLIEVQLLKNIPHKNLVAYHWVWLEDYNPSTFGPRIPCLWILQEYCNGGDLHSFVIGPQQEDLNPAELLKKRRRRGSALDSQSPPNLRGPSRLTFDDIFSFFRDITSGLHHLHSKGYIHRDLKPSNCLLQRDGSKIRVLISDFGEVQAAGDLRASTGATGTISYCAPEVLQQGIDGKFGDFTTKSDIFSLGMIVYFMCFGRLPYSNADDINEENEDLNELRAEITRWTGFDDTTRVRSDLPEKLYRFLKRLLSLDPNDRPSTGDILASIKGGGAMGDTGDDENGIPRVSILNQTSPEERRGSFVARPSLSTSLGRPGSNTYRQSMSPTKSPTRTGIRANSGDSDRPVSPIGRSIIIRRRSRKGDVSSPPSTLGTPTQQQSPRLMLPPPPARPVTDRLVKLSQHLTLATGLGTLLFIAKMLMLFVPCSPFATTSWIMYPLLALAALELGVLRFDLARSIATAVMHVAIVVIASRNGTLCEMPTRLWKDRHSRITAQQVLVDAVEVIRLRMSPPLDGAGVDVLSKRRVTGNVTDACLTDMAISYLITSWAISGTGKSDMQQAQVRTWITWRRPRIAMIEKWSRTGGYCGGAASLAKRWARGLQPIICPGISERSSTSTRPPVTQGS